MSSSPAPWRADSWRLAVVGALAGLLGGLFGVGGGVIMIPLLTLWLRMPRKLASGTSLLAILPMALVGATVYGAQGHLDAAAAALLALGSIAGAQLGAWLLDRLPTRVIRWLFMAFLVLVVVDLLITVPARHGVIALTWASGALLALLGLVVGVLSGLLGIGGGVIIVPALMLLFGASDLLAKGTSLALMVPTALSGTVGNLRRRNVDVRSGIIAGVVAAAATSAGGLLAATLTPRVANWLFAAFIVALLVQMAVDW